MSWLITGTQKPDVDATAYLAAVEAADGQALEPAVRSAVDAFVFGCKQDCIWNAIKASCILAGARTLAGALVPLAGTAPTNNNFVSGDYNRKTGLVGDGNTKYLDSNYTYPSGLQNNCHTAINLTQQESLKAAEFIGNGNTVGTASITRAGDGLTYVFRQVSTGSDFASIASASLGFLGASRSGSPSFAYRAGMSNYTASVSSALPSVLSHLVFDGRLSNRKTNARLAFYSIGESLDLALLDARVTTLINAFAAAIP
jgi:hypothetical protein